MPIISLFYGIVIQMYFVDNKQHHLPHIHAEYQGEYAVFGIADGCIIDGSLPNNKRKLVEAWIEIHREDLMADWELAVAGRAVLKIEPLH